jgi:23S rRNA (pseudouridine1915-N3)-methyltransferase
MQQTTILCVGTLKMQWAKQACALYEQRLAKQCRLKIIELPDSKQTDIQKKKLEESKAILQHLHTCNGYSIACDETGADTTSVELAQIVRTHADIGTPMLFIIGGAFGFTQEVQNVSKKIIRLSSCTLPHELCRILLFEQLYRANSIIQNTGYHHV